MLPLVSWAQLSTSGISKTVPSDLCKIIWSFVKEHKTAKIIKAADYVLIGSANTPNVDDWLVTFFNSRSYYTQVDNYDKWMGDYDDVSCTQFNLLGKLHSHIIENLMKLKIDEGDRQSPARPSAGKCLQNPICID